LYHRFAGQRAATAGQIDAFGRHRVGHRQGRSPVRPFPVRRLPWPGADNAPARALESASTKIGGRACGPRKFVPPCPCQRMPRDRPRPALCPRRVSRQPWCPAIPAVSGRIPRSARSDTRGGLLADPGRGCPLRPQRPGCTAYFPDRRLVGDCAGSPRRVHGTLSRSRGTRH
jgi:hypothetical protein